MSSCVDMTKPQPCWKWVDNGTTLPVQMKAIGVELAEAQEALINYETARGIAGGVTDGDLRDNLAMELTDIQTACATMLAMLGYLEQEERDDLQCRVNEKNYRRGYWDED